MISRRSLIIGAGATFLTRPALALLPSRCRGPFNTRKIGPVNPQCLAVPQGLVGYWPLGADTTDFHQGLTFDVSGNGNTGTLNNLTAASLAQGPVGTGLTFNGSTSFVGCGIINNASISAFAWVNFSALTNTYSCLLGNLGSSVGFQLLVKSTGKLAIYIETSGGFVDYDGAGNTTLSVGKWYFVGITYDSVRGLVGYVNGTVDSSVSANGTVASSTNTFCIGKDITGGGRFVNGVICCVPLYSRAIDPWEVKTLYQTDLAGSRTPWSAPRMIWR